MATEELERRTLGTKPRPPCRESFAGTVISVPVSLPLLLGCFFLVYRIVESAPYCEVHLNDNLLFGAGVSMAVIFLVIMFHMAHVLRMGNWFAIVGMVLVLCTGTIVVLGFPNLEGQTRIGLFHSSSMEAIARSNSEYWDKNVMTCVCRTEACEDMVYRQYLSDLYDLKPYQGCFDFSGFTKMDEVKRLGPPALDLNGTSVKNGDRSGPNSDSEYHEVCYSKSSGYKGNKKLCYDCYACEEKYLRDKQRTHWRYGNKLFIMSLLLVVSNMILFLAESWARYMG